MFIRTLLLILFVHHGASWSLWKRRQRITFPTDHAPALIDQHFMKLALVEADRAKRRGEVPIGAILVQQLQVGEHQEYRIVANDGNRVEQRKDASAHAELQVLRQGAKQLNNWRLLNTTLYSTLEPCPMCLAACQAFRLEKLVYGAPDLRLGAVETHLRLLDTQHPYHNISTVVKDVNATESANIMIEFFRERRKKNKRKNVKRKR